MTFTTHPPRAIFTERQHEEPLAPGRPDGPTIPVFPREVADPDGLDKPYLLFLEGGPGMEPRRPSSPPTGWHQRALKDFGLLMMDQRGTGRSPPVDTNLPQATAEEQADYLANFRAD